ncbi:hypothetical protein Tco_1052500, partial [Tanacetum coccineum]
APKARVTIVSSLAGVLDLITYSSNDFDSSEDPFAPEHASSALTTSLFLHSSDSSETSRDFAWRNKVVLRSSSPSSPTHALPSTVTASLAPCWIVPAPPGVPRRPAILVLPVPARISANHRRFHSSSSSSPLCKRLTTHSPSPSTRPSRKRCRPPTNLVTSATSIPRALIHVRADLLPPRKRIRGSSAALSPEETIEESLEVGSEEDIDSDVMADIEADIATKATAANEIRNETKVGFKVDDEAEDEDEAESSARGTIEIGIDRVFELEIPVDILELYDHIEEIPARRVVDIKEDERVWEIRALADEKEMAHIRDRINVLEGSNMRLREALAEEKERADSVWPRMGYIQDELRQIRLSRYYDRMDFRRLETFSMRRLGYHP